VRAHAWAREIGKIGHDARLILPAHVKPFVKRQNNDAADAEAICEAAQRPALRLAAVKSEAQASIGDCLPDARPSRWSSVVAGT
jgi:transposase